MIRSALLVAALLMAGRAAAQTVRPTPEMTRAQSAIGALWRLVEGPITAASIRTACAGASEEITALDAAMPAELSPASAASVRSARGLHVIPIADRPGAAYFFPPAGMDWFTPGLGGFTVIDETEGFIGVRDAGGREFAFQVGHAGTRAMLRIRKPDDTIVTLAGCEAIAPL